MTQLSRTLSPTVEVSGSYGTLTVHRASGLVLAYLNYEDEHGGGAEYADIVWFDPARLPDTAYGDILETAFVSDKGVYTPELIYVEDECMWMEQPRLPSPDMIYKPTPCDADGHCVYCGRDNTGYEDLRCADECPAYWEEQGLPHPDYTTH